MLAADEVPKIAQTFGLDSSVRVNMMNDGSRHDYGGKSYPQRGKGCLRAVINKKYKSSKKLLILLRYADII